MENVLFYGLTPDKIPQIDFFKQVFLCRLLDCSESLKVIELYKNDFDNIRAKTKTLKEKNKQLKDRPQNFAIVQKLLQKLNSWDNIVGPLKYKEKKEFIEYHNLEDKIILDNLWDYQFETPKSPKAIKKCLDLFVIGQDLAKRTISFAFYLHLIRSGTITPNLLGENIPKQPFGNLNLPNPNILLIGKTGVGKTYLIKTLCKILNLNFIKIDCSSLVSSGYVGKTLEDYMSVLYKKCGEDSKSMEKAIIYFDEFDKVSGKLKSSLAVKGYTIQEELLTFLEDEEFQFTHNKVLMSANTKGFMYIFSGSFSFLEEQMQTKHEREKTKLGFNKSSEVSSLKQLSDITPHDLIEFGIMPELMGRINYIVPLNPLTLSDIKKIMLETKNSPLKEFQNFFKIHLDDLSIDEEVYTLIAEQVLKNGGGARSITSVLQKLLEDFLFEAPNNEKEIFRVTEKYFLNKFPKT